MSSDALGYVFRYSPYTGATFAVHLAMGDVVNDAYGYRFFMSVGNLAKKARCERRTAGRALQQLVDDGFLEQLVDHPGGVTEYRFLFPDVALRYGEERPQVASEGVGRDVAPLGSDVAPPGSSQPTLLGSGVAGGGSPRPTNSIEHKSEPKGNARASARPPTWAPHEKHKAKATELQVDLDHEAEQFRFHHDAKGSRFVDWDAAFYTWLGNAGGRFRGKVAPIRPKRKLAPKDEWLEYA